LIAMPWLIQLMLLIVLAGFIGCVAM